MAKFYCDKCCEATEHAWYGFGMKAEFLCCDCVHKNRKKLRALEQDFLEKAITVKRKKKE